MSDFPIALGDDLTVRLARAFDVEGKILRALEGLGPVAGRDLVLLGEADGLRARSLADAGATVKVADSLAAASGLGEAVADVIVAWWSGFRGVTAGELEIVDRVLRPGGRLLVVHDYGRDDVSRLRGDQPEYGLWSRRDGPFLRNGFRVRVLHCWWTFDTLEEAASFLEDAFGPNGAAVAADLKRPRLSYNVAIYHRTRGGHEALAANAGRTPVRA